MQILVLFKEQHILLLNQEKLPLDKRQGAPDIVVEQSGLDELIL
jgi:hypothetical protein